MDWNLVGKRVKVFREARGFSQTELAETIGRHRSTISRLEAGESVSVGILYAIGVALDKTVADITAGQLADITEPTVGSPVAIAKALATGDDFSACIPVAYGAKGGTTVAKIWLPYDLGFPIGTFAWRITGKAMTPDFEDGDVVLAVDAESTKATEVPDGAYLVNVAGQGVCLRNIWHTHDGATVIAATAKGFPQLNYSPDSALVVVGRVVGVIRHF